MKNTKNVAFWRVFEKPFSKIVLPDRSILLRQKLVENAKTNKNTKNGETFVE